MTRSLLGAANTTTGRRGRNQGGILPSYRTTYPASVARALHALAESNPKSPTEYRTERARILGGTP